MKDIFATFNYACEKISENSFMKSAGYSSLKHMVTECKVAFETKYGSVDSLGGVQYILDEIEELYGLIDSGLQEVDIGIRDLVEKHLLHDLMSYVKKLEEVYKEDFTE